MSVARTRRRAVAVAVAVAAPLLGGCGIPETDVIEAGGPATVQAFLTRDTDVLLFFRSPDGRVRPVIQTVRISTVTAWASPGREGSGREGSGSGGSGSGGSGSEGSGAAAPIRTETVVRMLLAGPREEDRAAGLTTALPAALPGVPVRIGAVAAGRARARVPLALDALDATALRQLTCTIAYSLEADGRTVVDLTGHDGVSTSGTCGLAPGSTPTDAAPR
jgi:hypothetical protein